jgi:ABC-type phosphate transport system auxiliary subunit
MSDWILFFVIVVGLPVTLGVLGDSYKRWLKHRERRFEIEAQMTAEKAAQYAVHTDRLERRVQVLERIVTDKGIMVSDEIERLREQPLN